MYEADIAEDAEGITPVGVSGTWRFEVRLAGTTGTFNFRVQKTT